MDCQKLIVYGILVLVGIYILKDVCGVKLPFIEGFDNPGPGNTETVNETLPTLDVQPPTVPSGTGGAPIEEGSPSDLKDGDWGASEPGSNEFNMPIQGVQTAPSNCYPQNTLSPQDLLPEGEGGEIKDFNEGVPDAGEGILKL